MISTVSFVDSSFPFVTTRMPELIAVKYRRLRLETSLYQVLFNLREYTVFDLRDWTERTERDMVYYCRLETWTE